MFVPIQERSQGRHCEHHDANKAHLVVSQAPVKLSSTGRAAREPSLASAALARGFARDRLRQEPISGLAGPDCAGSPGISPQTWRRRLNRDHLEQRTTRHTAVARDLHVSVQTMVVDLVWPRAGRWQKIPLFSLF